MLQVLFPLSAILGMLLAPGAEAAVFDLRPAMSAESERIHASAPAAGRESQFHLSPLDIRTGIVSHTNQKISSRSDESLRLVMEDTRTPGGILPLPLASPAGPRTLLNGDTRIDRESTHAAALVAANAGTESELWAVFLVGAGLVWFQLRKKSRRDPIKFNGQQ
ncbi:MAG TPA: hypothetical protein VHB46_13140 [Burkholderiales bacterium]|nr:hypothetical protein [Burkholderiales bacterium]